jgi:hypothetical protein
MRVDVLLAGARISTSRRTCKAQGACGRGASLKRPAHAPPRELAELLTVTAGLDLLESIDLARVGRCPVEPVLAHVVMLAGDGLGNFWLFELRCCATSRAGSRAAYGPRTPLARAGTSSSSRNPPVRVLAERSQAASDAYCNW